MNTASVLSRSTQQAKVAQLNDRFRRRQEGHGDIVVTPGIRDQGSAFVAKALASVQAYDDFPAEHPCHDFGIVSVDAIRIGFKIDAYDRDVIFGSPNPADPMVTHRVMTVFTPLEW